MILKKVKKKRRAMLNVGGVKHEVMWGMLLQVTINTTTINTTTIITITTTVITHHHHHNHHLRCQIQGLVS